MVKGGGCMAIISKEGLLKVLVSYKDVYKRQGNKAAGGERLASEKGHYR